MTNVPELKFRECEECVFARRRSNACRGCTAGENFEPHLDELDPNDLELEAREGSDDDE